jgi:dihydrofolate reductase
MVAPKLTLVAARARNGVIGRDGTLPWRLPSDLKRFRAATWGKPVLMGRKTWQALPRKPLDGRVNLVVTRDAAFRVDGALIYSDVDAALASARALAVLAGKGQVCVIGGVEVFAKTLPIADVLHLTEVELEPVGDACFPAFNECEWREIAREEVKRGPDDDADFVVRVLERRRQVV